MNNKVKKTICIDENYYKRIKLHATKNGKYIQDLFDDIIGNYFEGLTLSENSISASEESEKNTIITALDNTNNHRNEAAKLLDISRVTLHKKMKKYKIERPNYCGKRNNRGLRKKTEKIVR
jgi:DNA-binding NtrC family response regulator